MKKTFIFLCLCCCLLMQVHAQSSGYSYVRTRTMTNASATAWVDHIDYDNGIGDVYQQVDVGITPGHQDLVTLHEYDSHRRSYRVWLPGLGSGGICQDSIALKSSAGTVNSDDCPYSTSLYEPTPLGQVRQQYQPGNAWYQNQKAQIFTEAVEANDVARYKVMNLIMASNTLLYAGYSNNSKFIKETTDEDGVIHQEFADMSGNVVVRRQQSGPGWLATYYVYDDSNRLRFVLPPAAANYFETNLTYTQSISPTHDQMLKYAYEYRYDGRGNCIYKRLPGCEPVYYVYDHAGRLTTKTHKLDSNSTVTLESNAYNNLGRLVSTTSNGTLTTSYTYNVRSWLKTITTGTLFSETLYYDESHNGNNPCFSGNISAMDWKAPDNVQRGYRFYYDKLSRLTHAIYLESDVFNGHFNSEYSYDYMGNMLTLKRYGLQDNSSYGLVDNLTLTYNGNLLVKADDDATDPTYAGAFNFVDGEDEEVEYEYDQNGNLTKDLNKNILSIQYNLLNLPTGITYSDGRSAAYIYDAGGRKLRTSYQVSAQATPVPTDYCGNMIYENNVLNQILVDGGYITFSGTTPVYHCYLKDHLGNNRVVARADGTVEQVNHYYPFGGLMAESTDGDVQRYKYNGKELDRMHGLDWYDYGARHMDGARGQFTTKDPLCEKYYNISPYAYCANDPINAIDINGDSIYMDQKSIAALINGLKDRERVSLKFNNGILDTSSIIEDAQNSDDFFLKDLYEIASDTRMVELRTSSYNIYKANGKVERDNWIAPSELDDNDLNDTALSLLKLTNQPIGRHIQGNLGQTLFPNEGYKQSTNGNIQIIINGKGNINAQSIGLAHEFGHVILYMRDLPSGHGQLGVNDFVYERASLMSKRLGYDY